ncbi:helix-turn-helix transcriptional regulator [uncultured Lactobacillus sp.]|nr:helix-turn-helix transcriptional regulator [uncultured Lactobacillus sp.]
MKIGEALKALRLQSGMTQTEMAPDIITESAYLKVERGVH